MSTFTDRNNSEDKDDQTNGSREREKKPIPKKHGIIGDAFQCYKIKKKIINIKKKNI